MLTLGSWQVTFLGIAFVLVCLFMMLVILIQKPRGGGLSGAFGGAGSAQAAFGAKTGDVLTWFTVICFTAFLSLAVALTWMINPSDQPDLPAVLPADDNPASPLTTEESGTTTSSENSPTPSQTEALPQATQEIDP